MHEALNNTSVKDIDKKVFETQLTKVFAGLTEGNKQDAQRMKAEVSKLTTQLKQMEANWAVETNPKKQNILWTQIEETEKKITEITQELATIEIYILNLTDFMKYAIDLDFTPLKMWKKIKLGIKEISKFTVSTRFLL
ncbi:MAG: hypothetical protein LBR17_07145 [Bacteroidales bacterium]|nr:hypothetical protein [Bacteroidales bacterium]